MTTTTTSVRRVRPYRRHVFERGNPLVAAEWTARAACLGADPEAFFEPDRSAEAMAWCSVCPVRAECGEAGRGEVGTWGGAYRGEGRRKSHTAGAGVAA